MLCNLHRVDVGDPSEGPVVGDKQNDAKWLDQVGWPDNPNHGQAIRTLVAK